jgi:hypothetical protein
VAVNLYPPETSPPKELKLAISSRRLDWQASSIAQICSQYSSLLSSVEQLVIHEGLGSRESAWKVEMDSTQWLELFHPFTAVRTLRISGMLRPLIVSSLQGLAGELAITVLPALDSLYLQWYKPFQAGSEQQAIEAFIAARQISDRPVAVRRCEWFSQND